MKEDTARKISSFFARTKDTTIKVAKVVAKKTTELYNTTKTYGKNTVDDYKSKKELERKLAIEEYAAFVRNKIDEIEDEEINQFLNNLGNSPTELTYKQTRKIKETFPIPREHSILWAYYVVETTRCGGLIVTDKGIFLKTVVDVFSEKALRKENRKVSELFYYPWPLIDSLIAEGKLNDNYLNTLNKQNVGGFIYACNKYYEAKNNYKSSSMNYYSSNEQILNGSAVVGGSIAMQGETIFVRNNGYGNNPQAGFGLFAEQANNMADIRHFNNARVVGGDNAKNGPDRLVNGVRIQTKYYRTSARSVGATFDNKGNGNYRYWNPDGTPMKLEVPKGQRADAVETMRNKIINGKVRTVIDGKEYVVTDPNEAERIIVEGHYTMEQVQNIAKAGTIESLVYDIEKSAVSTTCIFGISFLISSYLCYRKTKDIKESLISGLLAGGKVGALSLATSVLVLQLARTHTFSQIMTKSVIKSGVVSAGVGFLVFSIPETYNFAMKKISGAQYATNLAVLSASIIGGTAGAYAGGAIGTAAGTAAGFGAGSVPLAIAGGTGGVVGGVAVGTAAGIGTSKIIDVFFEGDDKRIARLFNAVSVVMLTEYLLDEQEIEEFIGRMNTTSDRIFKNLFMKIHSSNEQEKVIRDFLEPYFEEIVQKREKFNPDVNQLTLVEE